MSVTPDTAPLVSFFVLAYRQEAHVRAAIEGAFAQTWSPLEIILSDDCSPDGTFAVMEAMAAAYDGPHRVVLNRNPANLGLIGHINRVMEIATGAFVVQNAGDDVSDPGRAAALAAAWRSGSGRVKAVHSRVDRLDGDGLIAPYQPRMPPMQDVTPLQVIADGRNLIGAAMGWSREVFNVFGPLPAFVLVEDRPIAFRASLLGEIAWIDRPLLHYRTGGASDPGDEDRPEDIGGLYGYQLMRRRWRRSFLQSYLADMETVPPPDAETCRALCRRRLERLDFEIGLAEAGLAGRLRRLPQALAIAARTGDTGPIGASFRYLLDAPYRRYCRFRRGRRGLAAQR